MYDTQPANTSRQPGEWKQLHEGGLGTSTDMGAHAQGASIVPVDAHTPLPPGSDAMKSPHVVPSQELLEPVYGFLLTDLHVWLAVAEWQPPGYFHRHMYNHCINMSAGDGTGAVGHMHGNVSKPMHGLMGWTCVQTDAHTRA